MFDDSQLNLFDTSETRKKEGMERAAKAKSDLLTKARKIATEIAIGNDWLCHSDLVAEELVRRGLGELGNAAGSLFKSGEWRFTGQRIKSKRLNNHARELKVWELVR